MQVDPIKPMLKPPGTKHLKPKYHILLSTFAFKFNLRCYFEVHSLHHLELALAEGDVELAGRCQSCSPVIHHVPSNPVSAIGKGGSEDPHMIGRERTVRAFRPSFSKAETGFKRHVLRNECYVVTC